MADLTHLKLAHRLLTAETTNLSRLERAERYARAQALATLAVAEALERIAATLEAEQIEPESSVTFAERAHVHHFPPGEPCTCGAARPIRDNPQA